MTIPGKRFESNRREFLTLGGLALGGFALAACGSPSSSAGSAGDAETDPAVKSLVDAAKKEGGLTVYATMSPGMLDPLIAGFKKAYGLKTEVVRIAVSQMTTRFGAEMEAGKPGSDIIQVSLPDYFDMAVEKNWLPRVDNLPAASGYDSKAWNGYYGLAAFGPVNVAYNTNAVKADELPKSWEGILDPRWKGRLLFVNPTKGTTWTAWLFEMWKKYGDDYVRALRAQDLKIVESNVPASQQLAAGEGDLLLPTVPWAIQDIVKQGAPVANLNTLSPSPVLNHYIAGVAGAQHPAAAKLFLNYTLSQQGQQSLVADGYAASARKGIQQSIQLPSEWVQPDMAGAREHIPAFKSLLGITT